MSENPHPTSYIPNAIPSEVPAGFFIYHATGDEGIVYADRNVISLFGCDDIEDFRTLTGNSFRGMVHPEDLEKVESNILAQTFNSGKRHDYVRYRIITKQGTVRYMEDFGHLVHDKAGNAYYYVYIIDVEKEEYYNRNLNSYAEMEIFRENKKVDRLTGLLNMNAFYEKAQEMLLDSAVKGQHPSCIVVFDILGLREINRTIGREEGDARIIALTETIRAKMPQESFIFRGHEAELIVVTSHYDEKELMSAVMSVLQTSKSNVLFGIGSTVSEIKFTTYHQAGTLLQALEEAQTDLKIKKMLNSDSSRSQALTSLVRALEEVDSDTEEHVKRTQQMGIALGHKIGLSDAQLTSLQLLCLLHDIGKITVPLEILNKPGRLTDEEWAIIRSHAEKGYQIAMSSEELRPIADMILHHHERWDGKGYPSRLAGDEIPVLSRIISIVDAYDAMVNDRAYRKAMLPGKAMQEIRDNTGTQFDPYLAVEFLNLLEENPALAVGAKTGSSEIRVFDHPDAQEIGTGSTTPVLYTQYMLDIDERIIETDDYFEKITGYKRAEVIGKMTQFDLVPPEEREYYIKQVHNQFAKADVAYLRHPIRRKDGKTITVICNGERYYDSSVKAFRSAIMMFEVD